MEPLSLTLQRRSFLLLTAAGLAMPRGAGAATAISPEAVIATWYKLVLELVRHTATYSPPVASRTFGYLGVTTWEIVAQFDGLTSLAGQLNDLTPPPVTDRSLDQAAVLHGALSTAVGKLFENTGPTGQRALKAMVEKLGAKVAGGLDPVLAKASLNQGAAIAGHILDWAATDGGAVVENMGFPETYALTDGPAHWVPTSPIRMQQLPLLPGWGKNRPFAMKGDRPCGLPPPPDYSEDATSAFHAEAMEVYTTVKGLTDEQKAIARFWSDDPMLSPTPPGHWISIFLQIADRDKLPAPRLADGLARLGVAVADGFIACWRVKFEYDLLRPVTYIRRLIDPKWDPLLITPPFPEYPSGHSTQSAAAAAVLTAMLGPDFAFEDATLAADGLPARSFTSFDAAAREAALSRLYGGIHYRAAIERGLEQGACVGAFAAGLKTL
ncbi:MAG TPA: vanadium-dependent haloperoxidase [Albidovulum sp.]|nr:vanadium-dependent haloperoxidase [Albidovulum sp.]